AIRYTLDPYRVSRAKRYPRDPTPRRSVSTQPPCWQMIVSHPFIHQLIVYVHPELRVPRRQIKILDIHLVPSRGPVKFEARTAARRGTLDTLSARSVFPRRDIHGRVAVQLHLLGFHPIGIMTDSSLCVCNPGFTREPPRHRVAPYNRMPSLILELRQCFRIALLVHATFQ